MNIITTFIDQLTQLIFGVPIFKIIEKAKETKSTFKQIDNLATRKKLSEAIKLAQKTASRWPANPPWLEKWLRNKFLGNKLDRLGQCQQEWQIQVNQAKDLIKSARQLVKESQNNPCDQESLPSLHKAYNLYKQAEQIIYDVTLQKKIRELAIIIKTHEAFQVKLTKAERLAHRLYFKQAVSFINEAKTVISAPELEATLANYTDSIKQEESYENDLKKVHSLTEKKQFKEAADLLKVILSQFNRDDGQVLLERLINAIEFQEKISHAIALENQNNLEGAKKFYLATVEKAISISPSVNTRKIYLKLAVVCVKTQKYQEAFSYLEHLECDNSSYLRGFIYAQQKQWQEAGREWRKVYDSEIRSQLGILKDLIQRDKLISIQEIEHELKNRNHQSALEKSKLFIQKFGSDPIVEQNIDKYIKPWLVAERWNTKGSSQLVDLSEKEWLESPNISTLHNLTIALYEQIDQNPEVPLSLFSKLIALWFTLLANLEQNPKLRDVVWMNTTNVNIESLQIKLIKILETLMEKFKQIDSTQFERLRDSFRLESMTLNTLQNKNSQGPKFDQLTILPGCYHQYRRLFSNFHFSDDQLGALYSDWGYAVAACLDNHIAHAIKMKPQYAPQTEAETYAFTFVAYHEGCYHLQQFDWRQSVGALNSIQKSIQSNSVWRADIDQLCISQRKKINDFNEHLGFAQFWYDLLQSQDSKNYLVEFKAKFIAEQWSEDKISDDSALQRLNELKKIDPHNSILLDIYERVLDYKERKRFDDLMKAKEYERAVNFAKNATSPRVRFSAAETFIKISLKMAEDQSSDFDTIRQLGKWAYEIAPHEPAFQEVYRALRIPY